MTQPRRGTRKKDDKGRNLSTSQGSHRTTKERSLKDNSSLAATTKKSRGKENKESIERKKQQEGRGVCSWGTVGESQKSGKQAETAANTPEGKKVGCRNAPSEKK